MANYMAIKEMDINNGPGLRTSFWFSGCHFMCKGCHNKEAWNFSAGKKITEETIKAVIKTLDEIDGEKINLSILGGEPLHYKNIKECASLIANVRFEYGKTRTIWLWTGFTFKELEDLKQTYFQNEDLLTKEEEEFLLSLSYILDEVDVLIDGRYEEDKKLEEKNSYRGSRNQNIIFMKKE